MADVKKLAEELVNLTVKDVQELAKILKEEYGIEPAAPLPQSRLSSTLSSPAQVRPSSRSSRPLRRMPVLVLKRPRNSLTRLP